MRRSAGTKGKTKRAKRMEPRRAAERAMAGEEAYRSQKEAMAACAAGRRAEEAEEKRWEGEGRRWEACARWAAGTIRPWKTQNEVWRRKERSGRVEKTRESAERTERSVVEAK